MGTIFKLWLMYFVNNSIVATETIVLLNTQFIHMCTFD